MKRFVTSITAVTIALVVGFFHTATPTLLHVDVQAAHHEASSDRLEPSVVNSCFTVCQGNPTRDVDGPEEELEDDTHPPTPQSWPIYATMLDDLRRVQRTANSMWKNASWTPPDILLLAGTITTGR